MKYRIIAQKQDHKVDQEAGSEQLMKKWLQAFRRSGWTVGQVVEVK